MKIDQDRLKRQKQGFHKWKDAGCRGTYEWVTGVGKTFAAILSAKWFIKDNPEFFVVVCVPTDVLRTSWRNQIAHHGLSDNFYVDTVHNLVKKDIQADMLILDEIHMYIGEEAEVFPNVFETIQAEKVLGLTATLGEEGIVRELVDEFCPVVDIIDLEEAREKGYVAEYVVYNLPVQLTEEEKKAYKKLDNKFYGYFKTFEYDFDLVKECLKFNNRTEEFISERAAGFCRRIQWRPKRVYIQAINCMKVIRERKNFLYSAPSKIDKAVEIINKFPNKKFITFGQTTESADLVAEQLPDAMSYHSNINTQLLDENENVIGRKCGKGVYELDGIEGEHSWSKIKELTDGKVTRLGKSRIKDYILDLFRTNKIRGLCSAKALDVGFDEQDIELGIILSGTSKNRQDIQRIGRTIRKKKGKRAIIVQLYIEDSQDEKWLNKRQTQTDNVKDIVSISQIAA